MSDFIEHKYKQRMSEQERISKLIKITQDRITQKEKEMDDLFLVLAHQEAELRKIENNIIFDVMHYNKVIEVTGS